MNTNNLRNDFFELLEDMDTDVNELYDYLDDYLANGESVAISNDCVRTIITVPSYVEYDLFNDYIFKCVFDSMDILPNDLVGEVEFYNNNKKGIRTAVFTVSKEFKQQMYTVNRINNTNTYAVSCRYGEVSKKFIENFLINKKAYSYVTEKLKSLDGVVFVTLDYVSRIRY